MPVSPRSGPLAAGRTNLEIAGELIIAEGTARRHVANIYEKIGAGNRAEATRYALREGMLALDGESAGLPMNRSNSKVRLEGKCPRF